VNKVLTPLVALLIAASPCWSQESAPTTEKPSIYASEAVVLTAVVEAINHETREVTLRGPEGNSVNFVASEEARNLSQVQVGDIVNAEYVQSVSIEVFANNGIEAGVGKIMAAGRSEAGEMPAGMVAGSVVVAMTVEEINIETNTFKLKGPNGEIKEYEARDPENLKKVEVGDLVVITYTEALALLVEKVESE
jgi:hypothetical protein